MRVFSTIKQSVDIARLLEQHIIKRDELLYYEDGWDDARVAKETSTEANPLNANHVATIRKELYGNFARPEKPKATGTNAALLARIEFLEARHETLTKQFAALATLHERLCNKLSVDRVSDVRYLGRIVDGKEAGSPAVNHS